MLAGSEAPLRSLLALGRSNILCSDRLIAQCLRTLPVQPIRRGQLRLSCNMLPLKRKHRFGILLLLKLSNRGFNGMSCIGQLG